MVPLKSVEHHSQKQHAEKCTVRQVPRAIQKQNKSSTGGARAACIAA
jgi:hypothetical protein